VKGTADRLKEQKARKDTDAHTHTRAYTSALKAVETDVKKEKQFSQGEPKRCREKVWERSREKQRETERKKEKQRETERYRERHRDSKIKTTKMHTDSHRVTRTHKHTSTHTQQWPTHNDVRLVRVENASLAMDVNWLL
jgi:hypothetical protein